MLYTSCYVLVKNARVTNIYIFNVVITTYTFNIILYIVINLKKYLAISVKKKKKN